MNWREVTRAPDAPCPELGQDPIAVRLCETAAQSHDINEPADPTITDGHLRQNQFRAPGQSELIRPGHGLAPFQDRLNSFELREPERATYFRQPVVITQLFVLEPVIRLTPPLITQTLQSGGPFRIVRHNYSALARGDLFIRIKSENPDLPYAAR